MKTRAAVLREIGAERGDEGTGKPLVTPILQTPIFEDVTLNVIPRSARVLYAEEGAAE